MAEQVAKSGADHRVTYAATRALDSLMEGQDELGRRYIGDIPDDALEYVLGVVGRLQGMLVASVAVYEVERVSREQIELNPGEVIDAEVVG